MTWIISRTGMHERRIAAADEFPSDMGAQAARQALQACDVYPKEIDMILVATMSPDYISPSTANLIQAKIQAEHAASMDIQAACTGFLYALSIAKAYVESGIYRYVLVIATEKMSAFIDYKDRSTCVLFGDGAAAAVDRCRRRRISDRYFMFRIRWTIGRSCQNSCWRFTPSGLA